MRRRQGFTLVELMVSMALIIFIMAILSEAFSASSKAFRDLKAVGEMNRRLRTATTLLRRDLGSDHFEGKKRLSDATFWANGPPHDGFFRVWQGSPTGGGVNVVEGDDVGGTGSPPYVFPSFRSVDHMLHFSVKYRGNLRSDFLLASVPSGSSLEGQTSGPTQQGIDSQYMDAAGAYRYSWAEVVYFLRAATNPANVQMTANGTPLYNLYRRQLVAVTDNSNVTGGIPGPYPNPSYLEVSCFQNPLSTNLWCNSSIDLTVPGRRFAMGGGVIPTGKDLITGRTSYPTYSDQGGTNNGGYTGLQGADLLLNDVVSFDVRLLLKNGTDFVALDDATVQAFSGGNPSFPATGPFVFDTWTQVKDDKVDYSTVWNQTGSATSIPLYQSTTSPGTFIGIKAIQVTLRIWDYKTEQTRQVTLVQDL